MTRKKAAIVLICSVVVCLCAAIVISKSDKKSDFAEIYVDSRLLYTINLNTDAEFTVPGYTPGSENTVRVEGGTLRVISATCADKVCVHQGALGAAPIVCLPNRVVIRFAENNSEYDGIAG
ncbi:MAG: NusG domain II-containing protein [Oscillospiraceae bacterium]|jgi:hypothetical protein|nr:NusG domain II-containing protein [Oscillospiraceae bacterium]